MRRLLYGDCLDLMLDIPDNSIDLILADLPYGTTKCAWDAIIPFESLWKQYERISKPTTPIVLFAAEPFASALRLSNLKLYKYDWIWDKIKGTGFLNAKKQPMRNHENVCVFYRKQCAYNPQKTIGHINKKSYRKADFQTEVYGKMSKNNNYESTERYPRSIQVFSTDTQNSSLHPTQKPVSLCEYFILTYTNPNDLVLDNVAGSGTVGEACENTGRGCLLMEKDEQNFNTAKVRLPLFSNV